MFGKHFREKKANVAFGRDLIYHTRLITNDFASITVVLLKN